MLAQEFIAALDDLAVARPVFHSESDFKHAFAWGLQQRWPEAGVRLEVPLRQTLGIRVDIIVRIGKARVGIELKYKTKPQSIQVADELFSLAGQGAQDNGRFDYCRDIERLEQAITLGGLSEGLAVLITNDKSYWSHGSQNYSDHWAFRLCHGRTLSGQLAWAKGKPRNDERDRTIDLGGQYQLCWKDFGVHGLRYLASPVPPHELRR